MRSIVFFIFASLFICCNRQDRGTVFSNRIEADPDISYSVIYDSTRLILKTSKEVYKPEMWLHFYGNQFDKVSHSHKKEFKYTFTYLGQEDDCFVYYLPKDTFPELISLKYYYFGTYTDYYWEPQEQCISIIPKDYFTEELIRRHKESQFLDQDIKTFALLDNFNAVTQYTRRLYMGDYLLAVKKDSIKRDNLGSRIVYISRISPSERYIHFEKECKRLDNDSVIQTNFLYADSIYRNQKTLGYSVYKCGYCIKESEFEKEISRTINK